MIEAKNLIFAYKNKRVLNKINLKFDKGNFYGIIGPNGSGKSTLLKLMDNKIHSDFGDISIENKNISDYKRKELAKKISFMPQSRHKPDMTVFDFVACGRFPYKKLGARLCEEDIEIIIDAMKNTNTLEFQNRNIKSLSGGECQRVFLAQLLTQSTDYLLCDEPTTFLDLSAEKDVLEFLKEQAKTKCVIAVLHNISLALKYCDFVAVLENGNLVDFGTSNDIVENKTVDNVFGTRCHIVQLDGVEHYLCD